MKKSGEGKGGRENDIISAAGRGEEGEKRDIAGGEEVDV